LVILISKYIEDPQEVTKPSLQAHHLELYSPTLQRLSIHKIMNTRSSNKPVPLGPFDFPQDERNWTSGDDPDTITLAQTLRPDAKVTLLRAEWAEKHGVGVLHIVEGRSTLKVG
jgi:hypothetical protein